MPFKRFSERVGRVVGLIVIGLGVITIALMILLQSFSFFNSLITIFYSFKLTGSIKAAATSIVISGLILVGAYYWIKTNPEKAKDPLLRLYNKLVGILIVLLAFCASGIVVITVSSLCASPMIIQHAISLVHDYESRNGLPQSSLTTGWSHNDFVTAEGFVPESENYMVYSLDSYESLQVGLQSGVPFTFNGRIENSEEALEEQLTILNKTLYVVYDLKNEPKLLKFEPETLKKYSKQISVGEASAMEVSARTLVFDVKKAVEKEKIKPISLG